MASSCATLGGLEIRGECGEERSALHEDPIARKSLGSPTGPGMQAPSSSLFYAGSIIDDLHVGECARVA